MEIATVRTDVQGTLVQGIGGIFFFNESWTNKTPKAQQPSAHNTQRKPQNNYTNNFKPSARG
jgi:hypothetical protein